MPTARNPLSSIAVITCYFNPNGYATKRLNYERFAEAVNATGSLITIECAFNGDDFDLPSTVAHTRVRASSVLWQKERLLNMVIDKLPSDVTKVAWVDCDLLFENEDWLSDTARELDRSCIVQPFEMAVRLPRGDHEDAGDGERYESFGSTFRRNPLSIGWHSGQRHGHSGFAWAARRESLPHGLYDACISGNGDHLMAHAFVGDWETPCFQRHFDDNQPYWEHFEAWCRATYPHVRSKIGYVPGKVLHLWHGDPDERRYMDRNRELNAFAFDPHEDIRPGPTGCYEWSSPKPDLHRWAERYFGARQEDGTMRPAPTKETLIDRVRRAQDRACSQAHASRLTTLIAAIADAPAIDDATSLANAALGIRNDRR